MIRLFRKIRRHFLTENKFSRYLIYAIGEIILVVIGILIALSVNNWNNKNLQKERLYNTYSSILEELSYVSSSTENVIKRTDSTISQNKKSLLILQSQHKDSAYLLEETLGGFVALTSLKFDLPVTSGFIADDNTKKLKNVELKRLLLKLKSQLSFLDIFQNYATNQYQILIEPFLVKNLNYARIQHRDIAIDVNQNINYSQLLDNLELANILNLKLETDTDASILLRRFNSTIKNLEVEILNEKNKE